MSKESLIVEAVFAEALTKSPGVERSTFLEVACAGNQKLRDEVESLLQAHDEAGDFLMRPAAEILKNGFDPLGLSSVGTTGETCPAGLVEVPGDMIGPYKLLQQIAEGGMGTVWMAEQREPMRRMVALKLIKPGMDSRQVLARFEAERQVLALMDHPNIAKILDAGVTTRGAPYFVMELVKGVPITRFCDEERLSIQERLELFVPVCEAIQHAHQKGIIHRDIKPSNVLVALYDGRAVPKVIDFGIAKATGPRVTSGTFFTEFGAIIGTIEYMSPEQAELNQLDIDTRSDVYSLGVLLYELLTGTTPLTRDSIAKGAFDEVLRRIREEEPQRPSLRISDSRDTLPRISAQRKLEPRQLTKMIRGDLDWIVIKALDKVRNRRYDSAHGLSRDVLNFLRDEPVNACPPSVRYRVVKFVRKYRVAVAATLGFVLLLAAATAVSTCLAVWANRERGRAVEAENTARDERDEAQKARDAEATQKREAKEQRDRAVRAEADARAVLHFVQDQVLAAARPEGQEGGLGKDATIRAAIDAAEPQIATEFGDRPLVESSIRNVLGRTFMCLGDFPHAIVQQERALLLQRGSAAPGDADTLTAMNNLATAYQGTGRHRDAIVLLEETLEIRQKKLGDDHPDTLASLNNLALCYQAAGQLEKAQVVLQKVLEKARTVRGPDDSWTLTTMSNLSTVCMDLGCLAEAIQLGEDVVRLRTAKIGRDHPDTLTALNNLAGAYRQAGHAARAVPLFQEVLENIKRKLGADHPNTLRTMNNLALALAAAGQSAEAIRLYEDTLELQSAKLGKGHPDSLPCLFNLGLAYRDVGQAEKALPRLSEAVDVARKNLGRDHPTTIMMESNLGRVLVTVGNPAVAEPLFLEILQWERRKFEDAADPSKLAPERLILAGMLADLGGCYISGRKYAQAETVLRESLSIREKEQPDAWNRFNVASLLGAALLGQEKFIEAEPLLLSGYEEMVRRAASIPPSAAFRVREAGEKVGKLYEAWGKPEKASEWRKKLEDAGGGKNS